MRRVLLPPTQAVTVQRSFRSLNLRLFSQASQEINFSLFKKIPVSEQLSVEFRAECFNLFNCVDLYQPIANLASASFGLSQAASDRRIIQFELRLSF